MARKIALINMKGGVGKSTLTVNLAWEVATQPWHKKVLVIDLDPQFNCTQYLMQDREIEHILADERPTVWHIFEQHTSVPGRSASPLDPVDALVGIYGRDPRPSWVDTLLAAELGRPPYQPSDRGVIHLIPSQLELSQTLRSPGGKEHLLAQAIEQIEENYDLVLIDCAPTESVLTTAAYFVADYVLVPVRPEYLATIGLPLLRQSLNQFQADHRTDPPEILGLVFNAVSGYSPEETTSQAEVRRVANQNGWPIFRAEIPASRSFPSGARRGAPIFSTPYARYDVRDDVRVFAREFVRRIGL